MTLNINRLIHSTRAEGPGNRFAIWLQGCSRHCQGCFATDTWSFEPHLLYSADDIAGMIEKEPDIEGITILGGEPFAQADELAELILKIKLLGLTIILFTGYGFYELKSSSNDRIQMILNNIDVLIDGEYKEDQRNFDIPLIGSSNQNIIFLSEKYTMNDFKTNKIEIRISKNGTIHYNGMGDFDQIKSLLRSDHDI